MKESFITKEFCQQVLQEMTSRYEEMFAHFQSIRSILGQLGEMGLLAQYAAVVTDQNFRVGVHAKFDALYAEIQNVSPETKAADLIAKIPLVPSVS